MEVITEHKETSKTLTGVTPISQESGDPLTVMKPSTEETAGNDPGSVVVTTMVVEETVKETEVSAVNMVQEEEGGNSEATETEKEGLFGNLVGEDEGLKVNCSENGTSLVMEVDTSLPGVNGSYIDSIFEHDENASADPMDVSPPEQNEKNGDNETEIIEPKEDLNKTDEENVVNREDYNGKEDMSKTDEENVVNGEDNNGKELASHVEEEEDHKFVVGDFVWGKIKNKLWWPGQIYDPSDASDNAASQEHEGELLVAYIGDRSFSWCSPSQLKPFTDNFQDMSSQSDSKKFVNAVQKVLQEVGRRVELMCKGRSVNTNEKGGVANSGIKKGARAPKGNTIKILIERLEPVELVSTLKGYATMEPGAGRVDLEFTVLKSCLTAFYTRNGSSEEETPRAVNGPDGDVKSHQKRKQKSVAELMCEEDESKIKKAKLSKDKRKALVVSVAPESDESGGGGVEEETMSPRQRKKSRYLSPPYFSPVGLGRFSVLGSGTGSGSFKEPRTEPEMVPEAGDEQLEDSLNKSNGKKKAKEHKKKADTGGSVANMLDGLLTAALDPSSYVQKEKNLPEIMELVSSFRGSIFKEGSCKQTGMKKDGEQPEDDTSELGFIKQKLEWMSEMVQMCEESDMNSDVKASLEGGLQEVLGKVVKMEGK